MKMKKLISIFSIIYLTTHFGAHAQTAPSVQSKLLYISESRWNVPQTYALLDDEAKQVGTYQVRRMPEGNYHYIIEYNGAKIEIDALTSVGIAPGAGRIITWGVGLQVHFAYDVSYKMYDLNGNLIHSAWKPNFTPCKGTITKDGDFVYAARSGTDESDTTLYLHKVNKEGRLLWIKNLGLRYPQEIAVSGYNGDIALMERDWLAMKSEIRIYNSEGVHIQSIEREVMSSMEFIGAGKLAISGSGSWILYDYSDGPVAGVLKGKINGNVMSMHPYSLIGDHYLAIAHLADRQSLTGFMVDIYDLQTGALVHSIHVSNEPFTRTPYTCLSYDSDTGVLSVRAGKLEITYQLTINK